MILTITDEWYFTGLQKYRKQSDSSGDEARVRIEEIPSDPHAAVARYIYISNIR